MNTETTLPAAWERARGPLLIAGPACLAVGLVLSVVFGKAAEGFFQAYLYAFIVWFGLALGSFALLMIHHMTGGAWSFVTQRILEACTRTLPWLGLLFLPILLGPLTGLHHLYGQWTHPEAGSVVASKTPYLVPWFWTLRALAYFAVWSLFISIFNRGSEELDEIGDASGRAYERARVVLRFRRLAPVGLILYCMTLTFAATDWVMSLEPEWFSTIYGPLFWVSQALTVLAFSIIVLSFLVKTEPLSRYVTIEHFHHLGNLTLAFVVLWAYISFSQFLITWSGNLPEEIHWYLARRGGGLTELSLCLMAFHFFVPMMLLLFRRHKRDVSYLRRICYWILFWRLADVFWLVNPAFHHEAPGIHIGDVIIHVFVLAGLGGLWLWIFLGELGKRPLLPLNDPRLYEAVGPAKEEAERVRSAEHV